MSEKEVSKWQFIDKYYDFLIEMYKSIRLSYHVEDYEAAFKDLEQISIQLHEDISTMKGGKEKLRQIERIIEDIHTLRNEIGLLALDIESPEDVVLEEQTLKKNEMRKKTSELYKELTTIMSKLNMFMPKQRIDERLDIYK